MAILKDEALSTAVAERAVPLGGSMGSFDSLLDMIGDARLVFLGEATHGTHEHVRVRAQITKRLILEKGFCAVAVEADWADAHRVDRYVRGFGADTDAADALGDFERFPTWVWRNVEVAELVGWLRAHDDGLEPGARVGFHGLDLHGLRASIGAALDHLDRVDPGAAERARDRLARLDHRGQSARAGEPASSVGLGLTEEREREIVAHLVELQRRRLDDLARLEGLGEDDLFQAVQSARVVRGAEPVHRAMLGDRTAFWNARESHLADALDALLAHLDRRFDPAKIVVWAHNCHVGDARATEMGEAGEISLGQLARERHGDAVRLIGFTTYSGTVTAASRWGGVTERRAVPPALPGSGEDLFHRAGVPDFVLVLRDAGALREALRRPRLQRGIGVVYAPWTERASHYCHVRLSDQLDAVVHVDRTSALRPLDWSGPWERADLPEPTRKRL